MIVSADLEHFYELIERLASIPGQGLPLAGYTGGAPWPDRGVYFFRELGEQRAHASAKSRIVRVGTHAVSANSRSTLWSRLRAHRGGQGGGGNHRGSIFRLHLGAALLARDSEAHDTWGRESNAPRIVRDSEVELERRVSSHIGQMTVLWVAVPDPAGTASQRACIERNTIALISNELAPVDEPSEGWLGNHSPNALIRQSGLWNLKHVRETFDPAFLDGFQTAVDNTHSNS